jgi:3-methyladenine DNA glycosylase/8-oxoguanine DNA glycosylase
MATHYGPPDMSGVKKEIQKIGSSDMVSELEQKVMKKLYKEYKTSGKLYCWRITEAYKELGVSDGDYVGMLNDSKYVVIDGECLKLTTAGIRYMDSQFRRANLSKERQEEIIKLSPELYGVGINLKPLWRRIKSWFKK